MAKVTQLMAAADMVWLVQRLLCVQKMNTVSFNIYIRF